MKNYFYVNFVIQGNSVILVKIVRERTSIADFFQKIRDKNEKSSRAEEKDSLKQKRKL